MTASKTEQEEGYESEQDRNHATRGYGDGDCGGLQWVESGGLRVDDAILVFSISVGQTKKFLSAGFTEVTQPIAVVAVSYGYA